jgi:hypothetical protein
MSEITKEEKQRYQVVSKIVSVVLRVGNVLCWIGAGALVLVTLLAAVLAPNVSVDKDKKEISFFDEKSSYTIKDKEFEAGDDNGRIIFKDNRLAIYNKDETEILSFNITDGTIEEFNKLVEEELPKFISALPFTLFFATIVVIFTAMILGHGSRIFKNIATKKTPFVKDNITRADKAFKYSIVSAVAATIANIVFTVMVGATTNYIISVSAIVEILVLYVVIYIFRAGYQMEGIKKDEEEE